MNRNFKRISFFLYSFSLSIIFSQPESQFNPFDWVQYRKTGNINSISYSNTYLYLGSENGGILRFNLFSERFEEPITVAQGLKSNSIKALHLDSSGNVQYNSANLGAANVSLNVISNVGLNTDLKIGEGITVTGITSVSSTSNYIDTLKIDYATVPVNWTGGAAPDAGGGSGHDTYTFNIVKIASAQYAVIGNQTLTSS